MWEFFTFELRYWLRGWMVWIFLLLVGLMIFGAASSDQIVVGGALQNTHRNAPFVIEQYYAIMCLLTLLMTTAFVNSAAARDFTSNTDQIIFSAPIHERDFILGRYLGSALISMIPILGVSLGILVAKYMPWVDTDRWGGVNWMAHWDGIALFVIPNTIFIAAIIFALAALSRSTAISFLGALILLTGYGVSQALMSDLKNELVGAMLDPFGIRCFSLATKYLTVSEKNGLAIGYTQLMLWNRLIWVSVGLAILVFAFWRFHFGRRDEKRSWLSRFRRPPQPEVVDTAAAGVMAVRSFGAGAEWSQFLSLWRTEFGGLVKTTSFIVILAAALLNTIPSIILNSTEVFGNTSLPVTYNMIQIIEGSLYLFTIIMIVYYAGVLVWKERDTGMDEIQDVLPYPEWLGYVAKFVALMMALFLIQLLVIGAAVITQALSGYYRFQLHLYVSELLVMDFSLFVFLGILAFFAHVVSPNKYIGYAVYIVFLISNAFVWRLLKVGTHLVQYARRPGYTYSDFYAYAPYLTAWLWFTGYWLAFCGLLAVASILFWRRGKEARWSHRVRVAGQRFAGPVRVTAAFCGLAWIATGAVIFYNTKMLNHIQTEDEGRNIEADYEKTYKKYEGMAQPRVTSVKYWIDLLPETRNAVLRCEEMIQNKTAQRINALHLTTAQNLDLDVQMPGLSLEHDNERLNYAIYKLDPPLAAGESRKLSFTVKSRTRGFENDVSVPQLAQNGTFINNSIAPQIGYQAARELDDKNERKKRGLKERDRMPPLERNCTAHCMNTYLSNNSDWVDVDTVISTAPGQIAIAPGSLIREWQEKGRRYFEYRLDHDAVNFYSFLSADYQVSRDVWNGIKIEVYYLKEHPWNVPKMKNSIEKSFAYYTANFGPYTQKEARIIEFPRFARFAQAFPGTMPYSEAIGFIANLKDPESIDHVFYVVAHEMAHQWWAHQVIGANMQGATILSETLAQYSALMVMEKEYGRDTMRKFLKYEMDGYLRSRGREQLKERPLERVEANQGYIHYQKGSIVMYYLREMIGEEAVNHALRKVLSSYAYAPPPYPTSYVLVDALREQTPPELQYLIKDLFEDITLFSNRTLSAKASKRPDGKYDVTLEVESKKFKADEQGEEHQVAVDDWIEVGAFAAPPKGKKYGKVLYRQKRHITNGRGSYTFVVDEKPDKAGIDPLLLLVDRVPDDNLKNVETL